MLLLADPCALEMTLYYHAGIVTTTRVSHASPAGTYATVANRNWETDGDVKASGADPVMCPDITHQLVHSEPGNKFKVKAGIIVNT